MTNANVIVHSETCPMFRTLSRIGFWEATLEDEAAFRQALSTSSAHMASLQDDPDVAEAIALSNDAIQSVNARITDPLLCVTDGVIIAVITFACHSVYLHYSFCSLYRRGQF